MLQACSSALGTVRRIVAEIHCTAGDPDEILALVQDVGFVTALHQSHNDESVVILTAVRC
jgi:hypothetical protein